MHRGVFQNNFNSGLSQKIHSGGKTRLAYEHDDLWGKVFSRLFQEVLRYPSTDPGCS